jgi:hypothetical protein
VSSRVVEAVQGRDIDRTLRVGGVPDRDRGQRRKAKGRRDATIAVNDAICRVILVFPTGPESRTCHARETERERELAAFTVVLRAARRSFLPFRFSGAPLTVTCCRLIFP